MTIIQTQCLLVEAAVLACKGMLTPVSELATNSPELPVMGTMVLFNRLLFQQSYLSEELTLSEK